MTQLWHSNLITQLLTARQESETIRTFNSCQTRQRLKILLKIKKKINQSKIFFSATKISPEEEEDVCCVSEWSVSVVQTMCMCVCVSVYWYLCGDQKLEVYYTCGDQDFGPYKDMKTRSHTHTNTSRRGLARGLVTHGSGGVGWGGGPQRRHFICSHSTHSPQPIWFTVLIPK